MGSKTINQITETQTVILDTDSIELQEAAGTSKKTTFAYIKTWILTWIYRYIYPVGSFYVQYPDATSNTDATAFPVSARPATMFGGTWVEQFNTEGVVFQTAGYDGAGRTNGLMADQVEDHIHYAGERVQNTIYWIYGYTTDEVPGSATYGSSAPGNAGVGNYQPKTSAVKSDGVNSLRAGTKTSHTNRLIKLWKRTVL